MNYHALFVILEKAAKFEIVVCCKLQLGLYGLIKIRNFNWHNWIRNLRSAVAQLVER